MQSEPTPNPYESRTVSKAGRFTRASPRKWITAHIVVIVLMGGLACVALLLGGMPLVKLFEEYGIWAYILMFAVMSVALIGYAGLLIIPVGFALSVLKLKDRPAEQKCLIAIEVIVLALHVLLVYFLLPGTAVP